MDDVDVLNKQFIESNTKRLAEFNCEREVLYALQLIKELRLVFEKFLPVEGYDRINLSFENLVMKELTSFFCRIRKVENKIDNLLLGKLKKHFRLCLKDYLFRSKFGERSILKPRGYPGDFEILEAMYNKKIVSEGVGRLFDRYFLSNAYVKAVLDRKNWIKRYLKCFIAESQLAQLSILNLACGSCREIRELFGRGSPPKKCINFTLVDHDKVTIKFVEKALKTFNEFRFQTYAKDVVEFLRLTLDEHKWFPKQNLIYSIGLADYLPNSVLFLLIKYSIANLADGGRFVIAHKNTKKFDSTISDWLTDWRFIPRDLNDFQQLLIGIPEIEDFSVDYKFSRNQLMYYLIIERK